MSSINSCLYLLRVYFPRFSRSFFDRITGVTFFFTLSGFLRFLLNKAFFTFLPSFFLHGWYVLAQYRAQKIQRSLLLYIICPFGKSQETVRKNIFSFCIGRARLLPPRRNFQLFTTMTGYQALSGVNSVGRTRTVSLEIHIH